MTLVRLHARLPNGQINLRWIYCAPLCFRCIYNSTVHRVNIKYRISAFNQTRGRNALSKIYGNYRYFLSFNKDHLATNGILFICSVFANICIIRPTYQAFIYASLRTLRQSVILHKLPITIVYTGQQTKFIAKSIITCLKLYMNFHADSTVTVIRNS